MGEKSLEISIDAKAVVEFVYASPKASISRRDFLSAYEAGLQAIDSSVSPGILASFKVTGTAHAQNAPNTLIVQTWPDVESLLTFKRSSGGKQMHLFLDEALALRSDGHLFSTDKHIVLKLRTDRAYESWLLWLADFPDAETARQAQAKAASYIELVNEVAHRDHGRKQLVWLQPITLERSELDVVSSYSGTDPALLSANGAGIDEWASLEDYRAWFKSDTYLENHHLRDALVERFSAYELALIA